MDVPDITLLRNCDWDPCYLSAILEGDFFDYSELWSNYMEDCELLDSVNKLEAYCPIVEDISLDDNELCSAVEQIRME